MDRLEGFNYSWGEIHVTGHGGHRDGDGDGDCGDASKMEFCVYFDVKGEDMSFSASRAGDEGADKTALVLQKKVLQTLCKGGKKKKKKKKDKGAQVPTGSLSVCPTPTEGQLNANFWRSGQTLTFTPDREGLGGTGMGAGTDMDCIHFTVVVNAPRMTLIRPWPMKRLVLGIRVVPFVECEGADGVDFVWLVKDPHTNAWGRVPGVTDTDTGADAGTGMGTPWFCPPPSQFAVLEGREVRVVCTPWRQPRCEVETAQAHCAATTYTGSAGTRLYGRSNDRVLNGKLSLPEVTSALIALRADFDATPDRSADELRVTTYNILADCYATMAKDDFYSYLPDRFLDAEFRSSTVLQEVLAFRSDVVCLQECERKVCDEFLAPYFTLAGQVDPAGVPPYHAFYSPKGNSSEGLAVLVNPRRLRVVAVVTLSLKDLVAVDPLLAPLLAAHPAPAAILTTRLMQIAQLVVCACVRNPTKLVVVGNTHLFYHPQADHARLVQAYSIVSSLEKLRAALLDPDLMDVGLEACIRTLFPAAAISALVLPAPLPPSGAVGARGARTATVIFAGDLNSTPGGPIRGTDEDPNGVMEFVLDGCVLPSNQVWATVDEFRWGRRGEGVYVTSATPTATAATTTAEPTVSVKVETEADASTSTSTSQGPLLRHSMSLVSAAGFPECSNYSIGFKALLDYIFVEEDVLEVVRVAPTPTMDRMGQDTAIPSPTFPSDHVPLSVDLRWKS